MKILGYFLIGMLASIGVLGDTAKTVITSLPSTQKQNHLIHEKSPYLLQHAYNPVDWYPWGKEAFEKAKKENKPIFLSIGYSTCHWCHVMEHESFENLVIAKVLNDYFVSIKVDREERPDLDQIYMTATQTMTGSGGWPMSVWLNHQLEPFYTGTYFPPEGRYGRPGFIEILQKIHQAWEQNRVQIDATGKNLKAALQEMSGGRGEKTPIPTGAVEEVYKHLQQTFDSQYGGFGNAPKFPRAVQFPFLFRYHISIGDCHALDMALFTLQKMARGGMYDQLGGGFARYSVDAEWRVPHFEKMLYDNGQLLSVYTDAWQITQAPFYQQIARDIIRYVIRDMMDKGGGFYSAEDADSEGEEGTFYVWKEKEVRSLLDEQASKVVMQYYDFHPNGNFEHGKNVLHNIESVQQTAQKLGKSEEEIRKILEKSKLTLFDARCKRPRPHLDDKILTSWNGLMISGVARAGRIFGEEDFIKRAATAAKFILTHLRDPKQGTLLRRYRDGEAKGAAFLDDYSFFVAGLLDLFEATQNPHWLEEAVRLTNEQIRLLWDEEHGGFYFAAEGDDTLLIRPKNDYEGAEPSGNSVATLNLLRLAALNIVQDSVNGGSQKFRQKAEETMKASSPIIRQFAASMPLMVSAFMDSSSKPRQIVIVGDPSKADTQTMWKEVNQRYLPNTLILRVEGGKQQAALSKHLPFLEKMKSLEDKATAYVCQDYTCQTPTTDLAALRKMLDLPASSTKH